MTHSKATTPLFAAALLLAGSAHAVTVTDPVGDFLSTYGGTSADTDLDVVSVSATYTASDDTFTLRATENGPIGLTPTGFFVWGVNTGSGTAGFAAEGLDGVLFNRVVLVRPNGVSTVPGGGNLAPGAVTVSGDTITAKVSGSLLASTGFAKSDYMWNLWPHAGKYTGFADISDFAPNNADFATTIAAVPEPSSHALLLLGLGAVGFAATRRRAGRSGSTQA